LRSSTSPGNLLIGLAMVCIGLALSGTPGASATIRAFVFGGALCLVGMAGPLSGWMAWQNVALLGYGIVLPVAGFLAARLFLATPSSAQD